MSSSKALFPGTFDPFTKGHLDIVETASRVFDYVEIGVGINSSKLPVFTVEERCILISETVSHLNNVSVKNFTGLVVDHAENIGAGVIIRGLRHAADFDYEHRMAAANRMMKPNIPTVFLTPQPRNAHISSTIVRDIFRHRGDVTLFVPPVIAKALNDKSG